MPEQLTKHPEVTLEVLKSAGAQCGQEGTQAILTRCPAERFCKLPGGEICVFGIQDSPRMTQFAASDWKALAVLHHPVPAAPAAVEPWLAAAGGGFVVGTLLALLLVRMRSKRT